MYMNSSRRPPIFASCYIVITNVLKIRFRDFPPRFRRRAIRRIRKALMIVMPLIWTVVSWLIMIPIKEPRAIMKSKMFQLSLK